jgi:hypothetical protein
MTVDLESLLCREAGFPVDPGARAAVSRLLLGIVHDANGFLGTALLRTGSSGRSLKKLRGAESYATDAQTAPLLERLETSQVQTEASLNALRSYLNTIAEMAWALQEPPEGPAQ